MNKFVIGALALTTCAALSACGPMGGGEPDVIENGTIGFILPGKESAEMKSFKAHWEKLGQEYGVKIVYKNFQGMDPSTYGKMANELIAMGANAIICNFEMDGKENVIEKCIREGVYVGYSGSTVSDEVFAEFEDDPYFLGQIAPSPAQEQAQCYEMTKYFIDTYYGPNKIALPEGTTDKFAIWPADYHGITLEHQMTYRYKGIKQALEEAGVHVIGDDKDDASLWKVEYEADSVLKDKLLIMANNLMSPTLNAEVLEVFAQNPCCIVTTCMGDLLLNMFADKPGVMAKGTRFGTVDSFSTDYDKWYHPDEAHKLEAFHTNHEPYLVGKYSAINEAIVAVAARAFEGNPIRTADGKAININQTYWTSKTTEEFDTAKDLSSKFAWTKATFDAITSPEQLQKLYDEATLENVANSLNK